VIIEIIALVMHRHNVWSIISSRPHPLKVCVPQQHVCFTSAPPHDHDPYFDSTAINEGQVVGDPSRQTIRKKCNLVFESLNINFVH